MLQKVLTVWLICINFAGFSAMGIDKYRAKKNAWRIRERTLFLLALLGGSIGSVTGMYLFHHKTRHWYFKFGMPVILLLQILSAVLICYYDT